MESTNVDVDNLTVGNLEVDNLSVGNLEVDNLTVGNVEVDRRMQRPKKKLSVQNV
jgi:hypothetical protein